MFVKPCGHLGGNFVWFLSLSPLLQGYKDKDQYLCNRTQVLSFQMKGSYLIQAQSLVKAQVYIKYLTAHPFTPQNSISRFLQTHLRWLGAIVLENAAAVFSFEAAETVFGMKIWPKFRSRKEGMSIFFILFWMTFSSKPWESLQVNLTCPKTGLSRAICD